MTNRQKKIALALIEKEEQNTTKAAKTRAEKMLAYLANADKDDGAFGRIKELSSHSTKSRKSRVSAQGKNDTSIKMLINGKIRYIGIEVKTNGGRIENLYHANAPKYIAYSIDIDNSLARRHTTTKLFPTEIFLEILESVNAIKNTNGRNPERAVQAVSKKLYDIVSEWAIPYDPNATYTPEDFDGLEW